MAADNNSPWSSDDGYNSGLGPSVLSCEDSSADNRVHRKGTKRPRHDDEENVCDDNHCRSHNCLESAGVRTLWQKKQESKKKSRIEWRKKFDKKSDPSSKAAEYASIVPPFTPLFGEDDDDLDYYFNDDPIAERLLQRGAEHKISVDEAAEIYQRSSLVPQPTYTGGYYGAIEARVKANLASFSKAASVAPASSSSEASSTSSAGGSGSSIEFLSALLDHQSKHLSGRVNIGKDRRLVADHRNKKVNDEESMFVCMKKPLYSKRLEMLGEDKEKLAREEKLAEKLKMEEEFKERKRRDKEAEAAARRMIRERQGYGSGGHSSYSLSHASYSSASSSHLNRSLQYNRARIYRTPSPFKSRPDADRGLSRSPTCRASGHERGDSRHGGSFCHRDDEGVRRSGDGDRHSRYRSGGRDSDIARKSRSKERDGSSFRWREQCWWSYNYYASTSSGKTDASGGGLTEGNWNGMSVATMTIPKDLFSQREKGAEKINSSGFEIPLAGLFKKPESDLAMVVTQANITDASKRYKDDKPTVEEGKVNRMKSLFGDDKEESDSPAKSRDLESSSSVTLSERKKTSDKSLIKSSKNDSGKANISGTESSENDTLSDSDLGKSSESTTTSNQDDIGSQSSSELNDSKYEEKSLEDPQEDKARKSGSLSTSNSIPKEHVIVNLVPSSEGSVEEIINSSKKEEDATIKQANAIESQKPNFESLREKYKHLIRRAKSVKALPTGLEDSPCILSSETLL